MLCKLLKYDFKSMFRTFLPLWGIVLLFSLGNFIFPTDLPWEGSNAIVILVMSALLVAVFTITVVLVIQRFYNGLLKDEGYLMFTLPVKSWQLVLSKYITAISIVLLSGMVGAIAFLMLITKGWLDLADVAAFFENINGAIIRLFLLTALAAFTSIMSTIALIYLAMSVGHLFYKYRIAISIGAYIAINTLMSQIALHTVGNLYTPTDYTQYDLMQTLPLSVLNISILTALITTTIYLALTITILNKRLNLE